MHGQQGGSDMGSHRGKRGALLPVSPAVRQDRDKGEDDKPNTVTDGMSLPVTESLCSADDRDEAWESRPTTPPRPCCPRPSAPELPSLPQRAGCEGEPSGDGVGGAGTSNF